MNNKTLADVGKWMDEDKGYQESTHEKQAEFARKRNESLLIKNTNPHILEIRDHTGKEIVKITYEGKIYWNGREVTTDQEYRDTMMYVGKRLAGLIKEPDPSDLVNIVGEANG